MAWESLRTAVVQETFEVLSQKVNAFNAASNGALILTAGAPGDFTDNVMFAALEASRRRDRSTGSADEAAILVTQTNNIAVAVSGAFGPHEWLAQDPMWQGLGESAIVQMLAQRTVEVVMKDQINTAIAALVASMPAGATNDVTAIQGVQGTVTFAGLNGALKKMGDADGMIRAIVTSGAGRRELIGDAITTSKELFDYQGISVMNFDGKPIVAIDAPSLTGTSDYNVLGLFAGAAVIGEQGQPYTMMREKEGKNIARIIQTDYSFKLSLRGYAYNKTANPTDVQLATKANWTSNIGTNLKAGTGCMLKANQVAKPVTNS